LPSELIPTTPQLRLVGSEPCAVSFNVVGRQIRARRAFAPLSRPKVLGSPDRSRSTDAQKLRFKLIVVRAKETLGRPPSERSATDVTLRTAETQRSRRSTFASPTIAVHTGTHY
jgi:hypothetical protein